MKTILAEAIFDIPDSREDETGLVSELVQEVSDQVLAKIIIAQIAEASEKAVNGDIVIVTKDEISGSIWPGFYRIIVKDGILVFDWEGFSGTDVQPDLLEAFVIDEILEIKSGTDSTTRKKRRGFSKPIPPSMEVFDIETGTLVTAMLNDQPLEGMKEVMD